MYFNTLVNRLLITFALLATMQINATSADELYENVDCTRCKCSNEKQILNLDCSSKSLMQILANWPDSSNDTTTISATFSNNIIPSLGILPVTNAKIALVLTHCSIKEMDNGVFKNLKNLYFLDLSHNLLTSEEISPDKFKGPYNNSVYEPLGIKTLNLAYNLIHSLPNNIFEHLIELEDLNLEGNHFGILDVTTQRALNSATKLKRLNLADNGLTELPTDAIDQMSQLSEINLSNNKFSFVPFELNVAAKSLSILNLNGNPIIELNEGSFLALKNIVTLSLTNLTSPLFNHVQVNAFTALTKLRRLDLSHNIYLHWIDSEAFGVNQTLQELYINNNSIQTLERLSLKWSSLRVFEIQDNPLVCDCYLYNIRKLLSPSIRANLNGAYCMDYRRERSRSLSDLTKELCDDRFTLAHTDRHFSIMRYVLITLSLIVTILFLVMIAFGFTRYYGYFRARNAFATNVSYNPVNTQFGVN